MAQLPWHEYGGESAEQLLALAATHRLDSLVTAFETALERKASKFGDGALGEAERDALAIEVLEREVNNGGYSQFFVNSSNEYASTVVAALGRVGCVETATPTERAIAALPRGVALSSLTHVMKLFAAVVAITLAGGVSSGVDAQTTRAVSPPASSASLTLRGLDGRDHRVTARELASMRRVDTTVTAHQVSGRYSGVLLADLLALVHAPHGDSLRGKALSTYLLVVGADGYRVAFGLADFDPAFTDRIAILADAKDGAALPAGEAPFHLIIPGEKRPARWVRQVVRIELRKAP